MSSSNEKPTTLADIKNPSSNQESDYTFPIHPIADDASQSSSEFSPSPLAAQESDTRPVAQRAKDFEPGVKRIVILLDNAACRSIERTAKECGYSQEQIETVSESASMPADTQKTIVECGSRIIARRVNNPEVADWVALSGACLEWGANLNAAIQDLKKYAPIKPKLN